MADLEMDVMMSRPNMEESSTLQNVSAFWNTEACGTHFVRDFADERDFYEKFREHRFRTEWHIPLLVPFASAKGKSVLEIGTGNGADGAMFALNGAHYTGVDLTDAALDATRRHFTVLGLTGTFQHENAEALSFSDESFDWVYSHGVLRSHSRYPTCDRRSLARPQAERTEPGGASCFIARHSFNYFVGAS